MSRNILFVERHYQRCLFKADGKDCDICEKTEKTRCFGVT